MTLPTAVDARCDPQRCHAGDRVRPARVATGQDACVSMSRRARVAVPGL